MYGDPDNNIKGVRWVKRDWKYVQENYAARKIILKL